MMMMMEERIFQHPFVPFPIYTVYFLFPSLIIITFQVHNNNMELLLSYLLISTSGDLPEQKGKFSFKKDVVLNFVCGVEGVGTSSGFPHYKVYFYTEHNIYNEGNFAHKKKNSFQGQQSIKNCLSICKRKKTPSDVRLANQTEQGRNKRNKENNIKCGWHDVIHLQCGGGGTGIIDLHNAAVKGRESPFNVYNKVRWTATTFPRRTHLRAPSSPTKIPGRRRRRRRLSRNRVGRPKKGRWGSSFGLGVPWPCNRSLDRTRPSLPKLCLNCTLK